MTAALHITEKEFQAQVVQIAMLHGWRVHHVRPGMTSRGKWLTNVQGHAGFPDLVLAHPGRKASANRPAMLPTIIFAELKAGRRQLSEEQNKWAWTLQACPGVEYYMWTELDMAFIIHRLGGSKWQN